MKLLVGVSNKNDTAVAFWLSVSTRGLLAMAVSKVAKVSNSFAPWTMMLLKLSLISGTYTLTSVSARRQIDSHWVCLRVR